MGEVKIEVELENFVDRVNAEQGVLPVEKIRTFKTRVLVVSGAVLSMLPSDIVEYLGVPLVGTVIVTLADERKEEMPKAEGILIRIDGRSAVLPCLVGPPNSEPLLGQVVLDVLDLRVDCAGQRLVPNPASPIYPSLKLK